MGMAGKCNSMAAPAGFRPQKAKGKRLKAEGGDKFDGGAATEQKPVFAKATPRQAPLTQRRRGRREAQSVSLTTLRIPRCWPTDEKEVRQPRRIFVVRNTSIFDMARMPAKRQSSLHSVSDVGNSYSWKFYT